MANFYGVNATKIAASPQQLAEQGEQSGHVKVIFDQYTLTATKAQNDVIKLGGLIPAGARVIDVILNLSASLDAAGGTLEVGWAASADAAEAADDDGFMDAVDATAAATFLMSDDEGTRPGMFKKFTAPVQPQIKVSHAGGLDATSGTISLCIKYVVE
jgi:hypothetical protein